MPFDLDELFGEYDGLAADVARSDHNFFKSNLQRWFEFLDTSSPFARPILQQLESAGHFPTWFEPYRIIMVTGGGSTPFAWPEDRRQRLGMQLHLLRRMAGGEIEPGTFALIVLHTGRSIHDGIARILDQIFIPMSRDLRRYLKEQTAAAAAPAVFTSAVPETPASSTSSSAEILTLKPALWGMSVDLKELWRRLRRQCRGNWG
jgi:hypothetical protein